MPPNGSYNPAITLESILLSIQLLLASPNPDDALRIDVSDEYKYNRELYNQNAKKYSGKPNQSAGSSSDAAGSTENGAQPMEQEKATGTEEDSPDYGSISLKDAAAAAAAAASAPRANRKRKHDDT